MGWEWILWKKTQKALLLSYYFGTCSLSRQANINDVVYQTVAKEDKIIICDKPL